MKASTLSYTVLALASVAGFVSVDGALDYNAKLYGINYDRRQGPDWSPTQCKTEQQVWADMQLLSNVANSVRIYGLSEGACHTSHILNAAKNYGMKVAMGVWPGTNMPNELRKLEGLLQAGLIDNNVVGIHVGSEAIYRKDYSVDVAISYLNQVRELLKKYGKTHVPLTIADVVNSYYNNPKVIQAVDYVSINQFSFWEKVDIKQSVAITFDRIRAIRVQAAKLGKPVVVSETGWASNGTDSRAGVTSIANQKKYFEDFYHQAVAHELPYYWFVAIDLSWVLDPTVTGNSQVEAYFGIFDDKNNKKESFTNLNLKPRTRVTFQASSGRFLGETYNAQNIRQVDGVAMVAASASDKLTQLRYQWFFDQEKGRIRSLNSDRCLESVDLKSGGAVHTAMCVDSSTKQNWNYDASSKLLKPASYPSLCLDNNPKKNDTIQLYTCGSNNANQQWALSTIETSESPAVRFFAKESTSFAQLIRSGDAVAVGTGASGATGSEWLYDESSKLVTSYGSQYCLDAYEPWDGGHVHVWQCNPQERNQLWSFDSSTGQLKHLTHQGFCLDRDPNGANGGLLQLWSCHLSNNNQVWRKVSASAKAVRITANDASVVEFISRESLKLTASVKPDAQSWFYNAFSNTIVSKWSGECLDAYQPYDNGIVHTWDCIATEGNQKWKFDGGLIKHVTHAGFCLAYKSTSDKTLVLKTCSASDVTQTFTLPTATA